MESKKFNPIRMGQILFSILFFSLALIMLSSQISNLAKTSSKSSTNLALNSSGIAFSANDSKPACDCKAYCARVQRDNYSEICSEVLAARSFKNLRAKPGALSEFQIQIPEKAEKSGSLPPDKRKQTRDISVKQAISQVQEFSRKYRMPNLPPKGTAIKYAFILTTWRSGSSYFGEALASHPAIFYHYEPLMYFHMREVSGFGEDFENAFQTLGNLSQCEYGKANDYMRYLKHSWNILTRNYKIRSECIQLRQKCFDLDFLKKSCSLFPLQLFKLTRIRGQAAEEVLKRFPNSKIIYLVRDPRAIYSSRLKVGWCPPQSSCGNISTLCNDLEEDLAEIRTLQTKQSKNVLLVKYEHIALNPDANFKRIYNFLGLEWHGNVRKYLDEHTHKNTEDPMSTVKNSAEHVEQWKYSLANETVQKIQRECRDFMKDLHYDFVK